MDLDPSWLNLQSLTQVLQTQIPNLSTEDILSYEGEEKKLDNYSSLVTTIKVFFDETKTGLPRQLNLFSKTVIDCAFGQTLKRTGVLAKERLMYSSVLPKINALLKGDPVSPMPYDSPQEGTLILEDLTEDGYKLVNRIEQLDFSKTVKVLEKLAKFHAASVAIHKRDPDLVLEAGKEIGMSEKFKHEFITFLDNTLETVADRLDRWTEIENHKKYAASIRKVTRTFWSSMKEAREYDPNKLQVMNHGDLWLANIMFKFNSDNTVQDVKFVDFQLSTFSSPVLDLHQFLTANVRFEVFANHLDELLAEYLKVLNEYLEKFETGLCLSQEELMSAYEKKQICGFYSGIVYSIPVLADPQQASGFSNSSSQEMANASLFDGIINSKYYRKELPKYLKYFEEKGILRLEKE